MTENQVDLRFLELMMRDDTAPALRAYFEQCRKSVEDAILSSDMSDPLSVRFHQGQRQAYLHLEKAVERMAHLLNDPPEQEN